MFPIKLHEMARRINTVEYRSDFRLKPMPEIRLIKKTGGKYFLYSPLNLKIYILSKDEYTRLYKNELDDNEKKSFFEDDLLILKNTSPYQTTNINVLEPVIFLTKRCNLKCIYCFSRGGDQSIDNSFEGIKALIDLWMSSSEKRKKNRISFFSSGEPTLAFGLLKKTCNYVNRKSKRKIKFILVSNGIFPKSVADWIIKNNVRLQISCDGPPYIQDFNRPTRCGSKSSKMVEDNINYFLGKGYKNFYTHAVITSHSVDKMDEILNYFHRLGLHGVEFAEMFVAGRGGEELLADNKEYIKNLMKVIELSEAYGVRCRANVIPWKFHGKFCGIGTMLALLENGVITTCHNASGKDKASKFFIIGKYDKKTDRIKLNEGKRIFIANRTLDKIKKCKNCMFKWSCGGGCAFSAFSDHNTIFSVDYRCDTIKSSSKKFLNYRIQKEFTKIKPALEMVGEKLYYSMIFNRFELSQTNNESVKPNSIIQISERTNLDVLAKNIISTRNSNGYKTSVFLLSFNLPGKNLSRSLGDKFVKFLEELKKNRIFFVVTKPICRRLFGEDYNRILKEFKIPKDWFESVELFKLSGRRAVLRNGKVVEIKNSTKREDLYRKFKEDVTRENGLPFKKCKFCIHGIRKNCGYRFSI